MHVGCGDHSNVRQATLAIHPDVQLHSETPLLVLAGLMHFGVTRLVRVPGRAGCADVGGIHDGAGVDLEASGLQFLPHWGEQRLIELVGI